MIIEKVPSPEETVTRHPLKMLEFKAYEWLNPDATIQSALKEISDMFSAALRTKDAIVVMPLEDSIVSGMKDDNPRRPRFFQIKAAVIELLSTLATPRAYISEYQFPTREPYTGAIKNAKKALWRNENGLVVFRSPQRVPGGHAKAVEKLLQVDIPHCLRIEKILKRRSDDIPDLLVQAGNFCELERFSYQPRPGESRLEFWLKLLVEFLETLCFLDERGIVMQDLSLKNLGIDLDTRDAVFFDLDGLSMKGEHGYICGRDNEVPEYYKTPPIDPKQSVWQLGKAMQYIFHAIEGDDYTRTIVGSRTVFIDDMETFQRIHDESLREYPKDLCRAVNTLIREMYRGYPNQRPTLQQCKRRSSVFLNQCRKLSRNDR